MTTEAQIIGWLAQQDAAIYLVGGYVRDRLLGRSTYDLDLAVAGDGLGLARRLANRFEGAYYALDEERGTGRAILPTKEKQRLVVDVAQLRGPDLAADLGKRDFTVNALATDVRTPGQMIDLHGGQADLADGLIRPVGEQSIRDDPLRALRAVRQAAELGFTLAPETRTLIRRDGADLASVSSERIRDEFARLLARPNAAPSLGQLDDLNLLTVVLPELEPLRDLEQSPPHCLDVLAHSLEVVRSLEALLEALGIERAQSPGDKAPGPMEEYRLGALLPYAGRVGGHLSQNLGDERPRLVSLKMAALLHDTGKAEVRTLAEDGRIRAIGHERVGVRSISQAMRRLRFNRAEVRLGETVVRHHMRPLLLARQDSVSSRAVYRFFRDTGEAGVEVLLHALADDRAKCPPGVQDERWSGLVALTARMLADYWERGAERVDPPPLVDGNDLQREFGLQPGPRIGELLEAVREAQVSGEVRTRDEALALACSRLAEEE